MKIYASLEYLKDLDLNMINDHYGFVIDRTAGHATPPEFTQQNLVDLYQLKLGAAKELQLYMVRMRADQDNTGDVEVTLEEAFQIGRAHV